MGWDCILLWLVAHLFKASYGWRGMFRIYGNSMEYVLSVWAVFTWWHMKQVICNECVPCVCSCVATSVGWMSRLNVTEHHQWHPGSQMPSASCSNGVQGRVQSAEAPPGPEKWTTLPFMRCNLHNLLKSWLLSIKKVDRIHHDLTNSLLTKLESELSTDTGL